jgi:hypothetical protein
MEIHGVGHQASVNMAAKGGRGNQSGNGGRGRGGFGRGKPDGRNGGRPKGTFQPGVFCQLCDKEGHPALDDSSGSTPRSRVRRARVRPLL